VSVTFHPGTAKFLTFTGSELKIPDLSDSDIQPQTYIVEIWLDDGREKVPFKITFVIRPAEVPLPVPSPAAEKVPIEEQKGATKSGDPAGVPHETALKNETSHGEVVKRTDQEPSEESSLGDKTNDWESAFELRENQRRQELEAKGIKYTPPVPPEARLESISDTGLLVITFTEDMKDLEDFANVIVNTTMRNGRKAFEFHVVHGEYSDQTKIEYQWKVGAYTKRRLEI